MWITVDCFFKFLMWSCRACIAGTATVYASSGHLKCGNYLALFAEGNGNSLSFWRWSFHHFIWSSVNFPPSCHFFRSPSIASKTFLPFLQPAGLARAHVGTQRPGWWRQPPDMLWTWEAIPCNALALDSPLWRILTGGGGGVLWLTSWTFDKIPICLFSHIL